MTITLPEMTDHGISYFTESVAQRRPKAVKGFSTCDPTVFSLVAYLNVSVVPN